MVARVEAVVGGENQSVKSYICYAWGGVKSHAIYRLRRYS